MHFPLQVPLKMDAQAGEPPKQSPGLWYVPPAIWAQNRKSPRTRERVAVEFTPRQSTSAYVLLQGLVSEPGNASLLESDSISKLKKLERGS